MHKTVQVSGRFFNLLTHVIIAVEVKYVGDEIEGILVVLNIHVDASKVESVGKVVFIDLAIVFVSTWRNELRRKMLVAIRT